MKKLLLAVAAASLCFLSCNQTKVAGETKDNTAMQKNLDASHVVMKAFETGDVSKLDEVISPDFIDHTDMGDRKGVDSVKAMVKMMKDGISKMNMETKREWADDEYVCSWMHYSGDCTKPMGTMPAGPFDMKGIELTRFKDGKAVEHWGLMDGQDMGKMMQQMQHMDKMPKDNMQH